MKTTFLKLFAMLIFFGLTSCSNDDEGLGPATDPEVSLTFNRETAQDQMGDFSDNAMTLFDGKVWSFGGENSYVPSGGLTDELWNSANGKNWASVPTVDLSVEGRKSHSLTHFDGKMFLIGGENISATFFNDIWYSIDGTTWNYSSGLSSFGIIVAHQTIVYRGRMYVIAGDLITGNTKVLSTSDGLTWIMETSNAFSGRGGHKAVVFNDTMYVIGGEDIASTRLNEIWSSTNGSTWTPVTTSGTIFSPRNGHTATVYNNKVWIIGGRDDGALYKNDIWYSSDMITWTQYDDVVPFSNVAGHVTLLYNDALWLFGGNTFGGNSGAIWSIKED